MKKRILSENTEDYIRQKLSELATEKDMQDVVYKRRLSFGMDTATYSRLPGWQMLVNQKKRLVKLFWLNAIILSVMATFIAGDFFEGAAAAWWKDAIRLGLRSGIVLIFSVSVMYFSLFTDFRRTEREVRKLIYQDILFRLEKEKELVDERSD